MRLSVSSLLEAPAAETTLPFHEPVPFPPEFGVLTRPVMGDVTIARSMDDRMLRVTGRFEAGVELVCDRCLGPAPAVIAFDVDETLEVTDEPDPAVEVAEHVHPTGELDVTDLLRQHLLLNLPSRSLCGCEPAYLAAHKPIDPRWRQLESLLNRTHQEEP